MTVPVTLFRGKRTQVLGMARSGLAAARALLQGGADVVCWDDGASGRNAAEDAGFPLSDPMRAGGYQDIAALIPAPGIPLTHPSPHPAIAKAQAEGVAVLGDVELLLRQQTDATAIGITGTNGKSTTTALIGHMLATANKRVEVGGNLGTAALALEPLEADGLYVLEMSSYQLDLIDRAGFDVAVFLNITPDHLDRHGDLAGYITAKKRIFKNDKPGAVAIIAVDDAHTRAIADELAAGDTHARRVIRISAQSLCPGGIYTEDDARLIDDLDGRAQAILDFAECPSLPGRHNRQNALAAYTVARVLGVEAKVAAQGLRTFPGLAHRQERVAEIDGVSYINDSKATNIEAAAKALASYPRIYWIAGGRAKAGGFDDLLAHLDTVAHAFLIGEAGAEMAETFKGKIPVTLSETMETALTQASTLAGQEGGAGAAVLLSPACASFDQFKDFEARGDAFRTLVEQLKPRGAA
jgi:UDP-N-acetylmuramoylalanine--D-glutamate ligase